MRYKVFFIFILITHIYAQKEKIVLEAFHAEKKIFTQITSFHETLNPYVIQKKFSKYLNNVAFIGKYLFEKNKIQNYLENIKNKTESFDFDEPLNNKRIQIKNHLFTEIKENVLNLTYNVKNLFLQYIFEITLIIFLLSLLLFVLAYRKSIYLYKKIQQLKKKNHEKLKKSESLKTDMSNLRNYFDGIITSIKSPLKILKENFRLKDTSVEDKNAKEAINSLSNIIRAYENLSGDIILNQKEFNLNTLIKKVLKNPNLKCSISDIYIDFNSAMLKNVVGDSEKIGIIIKILAEICCLKQKESRILVVLSEMTQNIEGNTYIKIIMKNSKANFDNNELHKIQEILDKSEYINSDLYDKKLLELITAKRILESMYGRIQVLKNIRQERGFVFDFKLNVINRRLIQKNLFSNKSPSQLGIVIFGNNLISVKTLQSELEFLNLDIKTCFSWSQLADSLKNIYFFIDIIIIQNIILSFVDVDLLNKAAKRKNFINVIILEENEKPSQKLSQIENKKILNKPYEKETLSLLLESLNKEQKPSELNF